MTRPAEHHTKSPVVRKLRKTLEQLAESSPQTSFFEAEQYICSVCNMPVQPCKSDMRASCFHMFREGTELQVLHAVEKNPLKQCLSCGQAISRRQLALNPTAELCTRCTKKSARTQKRSSSKGADL